MRKKLLSILLAGIMLMSVCACGNSAQNETTTSVSVKESETRESTEVSSEEKDKDSLYPIVDQPITVKGLVIDKSTEKRADRIVWNAVSELTGINIEWEVITKEALATYLAANDWPDFFHANLDNSIINDYGISGGRFVDFYDYLDVMPHLQQTFLDYPVAKGVATETNGEMYRLPYIANAVTTIGSNRAHTRTDVLEKAGLELPDSIDEFYNCLKTLKELNGEPSYIPNATLNECFEPIIYTAFGTETSFTFDADEDGKVYSNYTSEQMKLYYTFMNKLYEEELIHQEFLTLDSTTRVQLAKSGNIAFVGTEGSKLEAADFADGSFEHLTVCLPFTSEYDDTRTLRGGNAGISFNEAIIINAESKYVEELCKMFDIMYATEEVAEGTGLHGVSFVYGIQGVDWDYNEDGVTYELIAPESYDGAYTTYQKEEVIWWNTGRQDQLAGYVTSTEGNNRARQLAYAEKVHPYMVPSNFASGSMKYTEDEQYILDSKLVDIQSYVEEMSGKFVTGVADIDKDWDTYCETLEKMGLNEVLEVYQAAYDRWLEIIEK